MSRTLPTPRRGLVIAASLLTALGLLVGLIAGGTATPVAAESATPSRSAQSTDTTLAPASLGGAPATGDTTDTGSDGTSGSSTPEGGFVAVLKVSGLLDPVLVDAVSTAVSSSERLGARALILQANSSGVVVSDATFNALLDQIARSSVPVDVWVGPSGSRLTGPSALLVGVADKVGMAPGTTLGDSGPLPEGVPMDEARMAPLINDTVSSTEAADLQVTSFEAPTIGDFIVKLPGVETKEIDQDGQQRLQPVTQVQFSQLSLVSQLFHTVASPAVAYLLLTIGLALLIFELFTAGVGVAGVVGAGAFILSCYGLVVLPTHWWGILAIVASMAAFAIDVQTGVPRFWTGAGMVLFVFGSLTLYDGVSMSWVTLVVGIVGVGLTFFTAMPAMVRTRFSTPTIGREWMIGEMGRAVTDISPDGTVQVRDALWRAYTNRATPIGELDRVRVVGIEGLVLEVEPEEGAARDYRERGPKAEPEAGPGDAPGPSTDA
ncbi:MAG: NfeD family protein [Acidimicrobiales bacterium]